MRPAWLIVLATVSVSACAGGGEGGGGAASLSVLPVSGPTAPGAIANSPGASPSPAASASPTGAVAVLPAHIPTWAFDEYGAEGASASGASVRRYLTYAEGGYGNNKAQADCDGVPSSGCSSVFYVDPNFVYAAPGCASPQANLFLAAANETWFVHETGYADSAHRVSGSYQQTCNASTETTPVYLTDQNNPAVVAFFASYMMANADGWDAYFMDDTSASVLTQAYGPGGGFCANDPPDDWCTSTAEYPTDASVVAGHSALLAALNHSSGTPFRGFFNGIGFDGNSPENLNLIAAGNGRLLGAVCENCVVNAGVLESANFQRVLDAMAAIDTVPGSAFVELNTGSSSPGSADEITQRLVTTAIAWLGFSPGQTIVFPNLEETTENLAVWPEDAIYPSQPLQSMSTSAADIAVASGVWRREFGACSLNAAAIGPCAAILNASNAAVVIQSTWLKQAYGHLVSVSGGDIGSGGTVAVSQGTFAVNSTLVPAGAAVLLAR